MTDLNTKLCESLTLRHSVCVACAASVEECCLAVGNWWGTRILNEGII